jgi:hypothetical protein
MIMDPGKAEIEQYTTFQTVEKDSANSTSTELNFEAEIGMNEHYDFAIYQVFKQSEGSGMKYDGFKLRMRYKIGEQNQFFIDPLIYLEYKGNPGFSEHTIEGKLILAKTFDRFRFAINPYFEYEYEDEEWEFAAKYAAGFTYEFVPLFRAGIEAKGDETGNYFGPTIAHGVDNIWFALGTLFKIGEVDAGKPDYQVRMIIGLGL